MADDLDVIADRLAGIGDQLADLAIGRLRQATDSVRAGEGPDPSFMAEERRITRARRSIEKAVSLLGGSPSSGTSSDEAP